MRAAARFGFSYWAVLGVLGMALAGCGGGGSSTAAGTPPSQEPEPAPIEGAECLWFGPYLNQNPVTNDSYGDEGAAYWSARFALPEGAQLTLHGDFPYSRYMAFTSYDVSSEPAFQLSDFEIQPHPGSENPFISGATRLSTQRAYSVDLVTGSPSGEPAHNTLYLSVAAGGEAIVVYRVYVPDDGLGPEGGVGLPWPELTLANGEVRAGRAACDAMGVVPEKLSVPRVPAAFYVNARSSVNPARNPPVFRAAYNFEVNMACSFGGPCDYSTPQPKVVRFYGMPDNQYVYTYLDRAIKPLVVLTGRLPKVPETSRGAEVFDERNVQLRYWSICQNEGYSQRAEGCLYDEQLVLGGAGGDRYVIVTSLTADKPSNARPECGINFLPWSKHGDGLSVLTGHQNHTTDGFLILRNMLPSSDFLHAIQRTRVPGDERQVMGEYLPEAEYMSKEEFEALGCPL